MNRLKLWAYGALLLAAGFAHLAFATRWMTQRALAQVDRELRAAAAHVDVRSQLLAAEAAQLAEAVARAPAVVQALAPDSEAEAAAAAQAAEQSAARVTGDAVRPLLVATSGSAGRTVRVKAAPVELPAEAEGTVWGAAGDGLRREGYLVAGEGVFYAVAAPAGHGASVAVGVPITASWLGAIRAATGCDVTLLLDGRPWRTTLGEPEAGLVAAAGRGAAPGRATGAGRLARQPATFGGGIPVPSLPLLFASAPALRVQLVALKGLPRCTVALSQPAARLLSPVVSYQWLVLLALVVLLVVGILTGLLVTEEQKALVPRDLVTAADHMARGDFTARAPVMAGSLGTVAAALNRAAEAAQGLAAPTEAAPQPEAPAVTPPPPPPPQPQADPDEAHWEAVYHEFVEVRARCGEARDPVPYERFRQKLESNRAQLVTKYGCRSVRFQVHVKDGRAALKATPVR